MSYSDEIEGEGLRRSSTGKEDRSRSSESESEGVGLDDEVIDRLVEEEEEYAKEVEGIRQQKEQLQKRRDKGKEKEKVTGGGEDDPGAFLDDLGEPAEQVDPKELHPLLDFEWVEEVGVELKLAPPEDKPKARWVSGGKRQGIKAGPRGWLELQTPGRNAEAMQKMKGEDIAEAFRSTTKKTLIAASILLCPKKLTEIVENCSGEELEEILLAPSQLPIDQCAEILQTVSPTCSINAKPIQVGTVFAQNVFKAKKGNSGEVIQLCRLCAKQNIEKADNPKTLTRGNNSAQFLLKLPGAEFGLQVRGKVAELMLKAMKDIPKGGALDPSKVNLSFGVLEKDTPENRKSKTKKLQEQTVAIVTGMINELLEALDKLPIPKAVSSITAQCFDSANNKFDKATALQQAGGYIFLRVINPAINDLRTNEMLPGKTKKQEQSRILLDVTDVLQSLCNGVSLATNGKKPHLQVLADYEETISGALNSYLYRAIGEGRAINQMMDILVQAMQDDNTLDALFHDPKPDDCFGTLPRTRNQDLAQLILDARSKVDNCARTMEQPKFNNLVQTNPEKLLETCRGKRRLVLEHVTKNI